MARFFIQEHQARTHHFDFRLEKDGVLKSWALPKGIPAEPGIKHLAIEVEDHPLEYGNFEGEIPSGEYGAGTVRLWDRGVYELREWTANKINFTLHGRRVEGKYSLVRFKRGSGQQWLLMKQQTQNTRNTGNKNPYAD